MRQTYGAVVVGTGFGLFVHVRALRAAGFDVRAIIGRDRARTARRAAPLDIPLASDNLEQVLADDAGIRLVTVATPPHAHYDAVMTAIRAGRHVVCEKPFARDADEARKMLDAATEASVLHMMGAEFRFASTQATIQRLVAGGAIGTPKHFIRIHLQDGLTDPEEPLAEWWTDASLGGGFLGAFGTHMIDQANLLMGDGQRVSAQLQHFARGRPGMTADDGYTMQLDHGDGRQSLLIAGMAVPGGLVMETRVIGSDGAIWVKNGAQWGDPEEVWLRNGDGERKVEIPADLAEPPPEPFPHEDLIQTEQDRWHTMGVDVPPYTRLFAEMRARIDGNDPVLPERAATFADAVVNQRTLDAARRAADRGSAEAI